MIIAIVVTTIFLIFSILIIAGILCCRWKRNQLISNSNRTNKCKKINNYFLIKSFHFLVAINGLDKGVKP
jgi:hypothetical protein